MLAKADAVDSGPLNVTDQWVVLIDPVMASQDEMAKLQALALQEQSEMTTVMGGLEKHIARGGSLPMLTAESVDNIGKTMKFGGPALTAATTVFDMVITDSGKDRCIALVAGVVSGGGGWGGVELGAAAGTLGGPLAPLTVPAGAIILGGIGTFGGAKLGQFLGDVVCPY